MTGPTHISSLVIQVRPDRLEQIRETLLAGGAEVPACDPSGKLVAVIETAAEAGITEFAYAVGAMDGVLSANLVYHVIDGEEAGDRPTAAVPQGDTT